MIKNHKVLRLSWEYARPNVVRIEFNNSEVQGFSINSAACDIITQA